MADRCTPCGRRMTGKPTPIDTTRKKEWRVFLPTGITRDYYTERDADLAIENARGGRKQKLSSWPE